VTFPQQIAAARKALHLTQAELAARLGVDKQSISNWECGRSQPWPRDREAFLKQLEATAPKAVRPSVSERILKI
jgi:transcriptional regulator with XRE-family HTH domain